MVEITVPEEFIEEKATEALGQRYDGIWGNPGVDEDGFAPITGANRDSGIIAKSNWEAVLEFMEQNFDKEPKANLWFIESATHWGWGHQVTLMVKVLIDNDGEVEYDNITDAFKGLCELLDGLTQYPLLDEDAYHEMIANATLGNIRNEMTADINQDDPECYSKIWKWLTDAGVEAGGDDGTWYSRDEIWDAAFHLNLLDMEWVELEDWYARVESDGIAGAIQEWAQACAGQIQMEV
jgi:hypothetical protein